MAEPVDLEVLEARLDSNPFTWVMFHSDDDVPAMIAEIRELRDLCASDVDRIIELEDVRHWALDEIARLEADVARLAQANRILGQYAFTPVPLTKFPVAA